MSFFQNQTIGRQNMSYLRVDTSGRGEDIKKRCRMVNIMEILCTHVYKWKNETVETIPGMGRGR
jgi:hypothetical protein